MRCVNFVLDANEIAAMLYSGWMGTCFKRYLYCSCAGWYLSKLVCMAKKLNTLEKI